jgi:hypothetical protein
VKEGWIKETASDKTIGISITDRVFLPFSASSLSRGGLRYNMKSSLPYPPNIKVNRQGLAYKKLPKLTYRSESLK